MGLVGPPIEMKMRMSCACTLMERGRQRSVYTLDIVEAVFEFDQERRF